MKKQYYIILVIVLTIAGVYVSLERRASWVEQNKVLEPTTGDIAIRMLDYVLSETNGTSTLSIGGKGFDIHRSDYETEADYQQAITYLIKNCNAIKYHNDCLEKAISTATRIEIKSVSGVGSQGEFIRKIEVTDQDKIKWLLEKFELPYLIKTSGPRYHKCRGNIKLTICYNTNEEHRVGYDHGHIMQPIVNKNIVYRDDIPGLKLYGPGDMDFKTGVTDELNQFLKDLGFSEEEIGIEK